MPPGPCLRALVEPVDIGLELLLVDAPDPPATDLYGGELAGPDQRVNLRHAHIQENGHIVQGKEAWLDDRGRPGLSGIVPLPPRLFGALTRCHSEPQITTGYALLLEDEPVCLRAGG